MITSGNEIMGSVLFERPDGEVILNWYSASLGSDKEAGADLAVPQRPLDTTWIVDYPILAYKSVSPDNKEISLVHMAQDMPQRILNLGESEFISFVQGSNERSLTDCRIHFLVKHKSKIKLMMIKLDPWKRIETKEVPFNEPESIFLFNGTVSLPKVGKEEFKPKLFTADKIKNV